MKVSVIIPTYSDTLALVKCLAALSRQTASREDFEVIVVDNHPIPTITRADTLELKDVIVVHEPMGGSYCARNSGIEKATGELLLFTDADCLPRENWIERAIELGADNIVGGKVELVSEQPFNDLELYEKIFYFNQSAYIEKDNYAVTANLLVPASIMKSVGPFDSSLRSGGDRVWGQMASSKNFKILYDKSLLIEHPTRSDWGNFFKRRVRVLSGNLYLFHREVGLTWENAWRKIVFIGSLKNFRKWTGDWDFYDSLPLKKQKKMRRLHRVFTLFDIWIIFRCKMSFKKMKSLTLVDRNE